MPTPAETILRWPAWPWRSYAGAVPTGFSLEPNTNDFIETSRGGTMPDYNILTRDGWKIVHCAGLYCTAWRDDEEILLVWTRGGWTRVGKAV